MRRHSGQEVALRQWEPPPGAAARRGPRADNVSVAGLRDKAGGKTSVP